MSVNESVESQRELLLRTQGLLQRAHDYIEENGFDIQTYSPRRRHGFVYGHPVENGRCCYIGTLRTVAGVGIPDDIGDCPADQGDGPELTYAFKVLDNIAKREMSRKQVKYVKSEYGKGTRAGRYIERLGLDEEDQAISHDAARALSIFRKALTKVHKKLEKLDAEQVAAS